MRSVLVLVLLAVGCATQGGSASGGGGEVPARVERHETFIRNPTLLEGDEVQVILPAGYQGELDVDGLTEGWEPGRGRTVWIGSGTCVLELHELGIRARRSLTVTLVMDQGQPEVTIQASGNVNMLHSVRGVGSTVSDAEFLMLVNDRSLEH